MLLQSSGHCWRWALMASLRCGAVGFFSKPNCQSQMGSGEVPFTRWELDEYYDPNPDTSEPRNTTALIFSKRLKTGEFHRFPSKKQRQPLEQQGKHMGISMGISMDFPIFWSFFLRPGKMYPRHAAFIEGAEDFAAAFFNISAPEAMGWAISWPGWALCGCPHYSQMVW